MFLKEELHPRYLILKGKKGLLSLIFSRFAITLFFLLLQILLLAAFFFYVSVNYIHVFYSGAILVTVFGYIFLVNSKSDSSVKLTWMILFTVMPIIGIFFYFYTKMEFGYRIAKKRLRKIKEETRNYLETDGKTREKLMDLPELRGITNFINQTGSYPVYENTVATYFSSGEEKFLSMIEELEKAEKFIFLEYFIVSEGKMWGTVLDILIRKANEGVEVRLMYDGFCEFSLLPTSYPEKLAALGVKTKVFLPLAPFVSTIYNFRDHRKICVIDGKVAFTGGVNLADEYINEVERFGHWKDTAIKLEGEAVASFTMMFLRMWAIDEHEPNYEPWLNQVHENRNTKGFVIPYADDPLDDDRVGELVYLDILNRAKNYVHIMTPYLILDDEMEMALIFAAKRGVDVRLILPHIPDKKYAFALAKSHYKRLLLAGVKIYEYLPGFVHAKVFVSDDEKATVGTINLDYRSFYHHFECGTLLYQVPEILKIEKDIQLTLEQCEEITLEKVRQEKTLTKLVGWLLKVVAPLM